MCGKKTSNYRVYLGHDLKVKLTSELFSRAVINDQSAFASSPSRHTGSALLLISTARHPGCRVSARHERRRRQRVAKDKTPQRWMISAEAVMDQKCEKVKLETSSEKSETWNWCQGGSERMRESRGSSSREWTHVSVCGTLVGSQLSRREMGLRVVTRAGQRQPKTHLRPD